MRKAFALLVLAALSLAPASAQQFPPQGGLPTPRLTPLVLPNYFGPVMASTSQCLGAAGGVTVSVRAEATLPATNTDRSVSYQILDGDTVRASGNADVLRVGLPGGAAPRARVAISATFDRTGQVGEGQVRIRIGGSTPSESVTARYSFTCASIQPQRPAVPVYAPDLAFDTRIFTIQMGRDRRDPLEERYGRGRLEFFGDAHTLEPNARVQLWDTTMCRGFDSAWAAIKVTFLIANRGTADAPATFQIEGRVADAPAWPNPRSVDWSHPRVTQQVIDTELPAARAATGRQSTIHFAELQSSHWLVRGRSTMFNRFEPVIPCGRDRVLEIILDPDNLIPESDETNNRLIIHYDLLG